jgi:hypothetical protein
MPFKAIANRPTSIAPPANSERPKLGKLAIKARANTMLCLRTARFSMIGHSSLAYETSGPDRFLQCRRSAFPRKVLP